MMDKKRIKAAVEALVLLRYAQAAPVEQSGQATQTPRAVNAAIDGGGPDSLFKRPLSPQEAKEFYIVSQMIDPNKIMDQANGVLSSMGYRPGTNYRPDQIEQFSLAVANSLKQSLGALGELLNI